MQIADNSGKIFEYKQ